MSIAPVLAIDLQQPRLVALTRSFVRASDGNVASMFALCIFVLFGMAGSAVDFLQIQRLNGAIQSGIDAGVLAGARAKQTGATDDEALVIAEGYMAPVKAKFSLVKPATFTIGDGGTSVAGTADTAMPTTFLKLIGIKELKVRINNAATYGNRSNVELSMMLDITGSMSGTKIDDLKVAVDDLISVVVQDNQVGSTSRVGIAPFSNAIKLDTKMFREATGKENSGPGSYKGCVVERGGSDAHNDESPAAGRYLTPLEDVAPAASCKDGAEIFPLTNKKSDLKKMVKSLSAGGATAGHLGTAWAWYLLSPKWNQAFDKDNQPAAYEDLKKTVGKDNIPLLRKIAVLMTDGEYNTQYLGADSNTQARAICDEMKKTGIEVFTVGFEIGATGTAVDTLQQCASSASNFYNASNGQQLKQAFRDIALKSSPLRIVK